MLEIKEISKSYSKKIALKSLSLNISKGEIFGLLGPNGAGKTTLIRIINQIITPDEGVVLFNNEPLSKDHLKKIGYLPEERGLYKNMTVESHAILLGELRGLSKTKIKENLSNWLKKFNIEDWAHKRIEELSKGMAQKIQFICTVLHEPDLLILDEPFSGFDPINVKLIRTELMRMKDEGKTIILSSHNMESVEEICDRVALINESSLIIEGEITAIKTEMKKAEFLVKFSGSLIGFINSLWTGYELVKKKSIDEKHHEVILKMRHGNQIENLFETIKNDVKIEAIVEKLPTLQEIFIDLVESKNEQND
ncbi:MAG: ABC transporter ATP-binding protein [Crocinitomicaceae bacterium]